MSSGVSCINWAAAFSHYLKGHSLQEISDVFDVPVASVRARSIDERWGELLAEVRGLPDAVDKAKKGTAKLEENRQKNLLLFEGLREDLVKKVQELSEGKLRFKRHKATRQGLVEVEEEPDLKDRVLLAQAARLVSEGTYRSLGDVTALGADEKSRRGGDAPTSITILLPGAISGGGQPQEKMADAEVIDLRPVK